MTIDEMISEIDTACGMLIVASLGDNTVRQAMEKLTNVSIELGDFGSNLDDSLSL